MLTELHRVGQQRAEDLHGDEHEADANRQWLNIGTVPVAPASIAQACK